jgi:hypothetical protein
MSRKAPQLEISRSQILSFRRRARSLDGRDEVTPPGRVGRLAGLHAAGRVGVDSRASPGREFDHLGTPVSCSALRPTVQRSRCGSEGPAGILARAATGGRSLPRKSARHRVAAACVPGRAADTVWRGRAPDGRAAKQSPLRGTNGHGPDAWQGLGERK